MGAAAIFGEGGFELKSLAIALKVFRLLSKLTPLLRTGTWF